MFNTGKRLILAVITALQLGAGLPATAQGLRAEKVIDGGEVMTYSLDENRTQSVAAWRLPAGDRKAIVLSVHGFGLDKCAYKAFAERMLQYGVETYAIDLRGFGSWLSAGRPDRRLDLSRSVEDIRSALTALKAANPDTPIFILGESMGGAVALRVASQYPELVAGVISSVPAADRYKKKRTALKIALRTLLGKGSHIPIGKEIVSQATTDERLAHEWSSDPNARLTASIGELLQFSRFMAENHRVARSMNSMPVLMVQGARDRLVRPSGTIRLYKELPTRDKQLMVLKSAEHLIFEEGQFSDSVVQQVSNWIDTHVRSGAIATTNS